jgi:hypothetical protein
MNLSRPKGKKKAFFSEIFLTIFSLFASFQVIIPAFGKALDPIRKPLKWGG